ncbi:MAG: co-chaperone GroES [Nanoarchaeota archaeon]
MQIVPLKDRILVKRTEVQDKTKGGIFIPDAAKEKTHEGTVLAAGEGEYMPLKKGDRVLYESFAGTEVKMDGQTFLIMNIKDVLAKIE